MTEATQKILEQFDELADKRKKEILEAKDNIEITGTTYYVSNDGNDANDGKTPETSWKTIERVNREQLVPGDGVRFKRGDLFRGTILSENGVTYCAYGEGEKPKFYGWNKNLSDPSLWTLYNEEKNIWKLNEKILDCGTLVFNGGEKHSYKHIPSYRYGKFYCRWKEGVEFDMANEMENDLDIYWYYEGNFSTTPSKGEDFPIPELDETSFGELYLRCDKGNPGDVFSDIEAVPRTCIIRVWSIDDVKVDNLCMKYANFAISAYAPDVKGLHVTNCEIGWIGGCIQTYMGTDPNYIPEKRGGVTRYGNGIEIYGGCTDYLVDNNYIYQVYDAGATHQVTTKGDKFVMKDVCYSNNLIEHCVYAIEYFLDERVKGTGSVMDGIEMRDNILRFGGYGWGQQRHNTHTPALIKGWSYENTARNYTVHNNILDRCAYRLVHLVAEKEEYLPEMYENTYIQKFGMTLGQFGAKEKKEPEIMAFYENSEEIIKNEIGDQGAKVYYIK